MLLAMWRCYQQCGVDAKKPANPQVARQIVLSKIILKLSVYDAREVRKVVRIGAYVISVSQPTSEDN